MSRPYHRSGTVWCRLPFMTDLGMLLGLDSHSSLCIVLTAVVKTQLFCCDCFTTMRGADSYMRN